jgi:hydrogenase maturation protease
MFAWGNPSRGDDGVGPWFAGRFRTYAGEDFNMVEDFQLQVEHLLDCREGDLLLFVDACCEDRDSYRFEEIRPREELGHTSHALAPAELLGQYPKVFYEKPPPAFQLSVPGRRFELGEPMSKSTLQCCEAAAGFVESLLREPDTDSWRQHSPG